MNTPQIPQTDGQVFDLLHKLFGIGDYDEADPTPWHKIRGVEIAKIRSMRTKRGLRYEDFALLADYCARHRITIRKPWDLLEHLPAALRERTARRVHPLDAAIELAVSAERAGRDDPEWVDRLLRASGPGRTWVLQAWEASREVDTPDEQEHGCFR